MGVAWSTSGIRLQDRLSQFDFEHDESITPEQIWEELERQNELAAGMRGLFPRTPRHPVVAVLACMDARIDISELVGDTRRYYYVVRTAGSVLSPAEQDMLELAVLNGVKIIVLTTHTDCAAEAAAADPELREKFPALISLMDERVRRVEEFMARPTIRDAIAEGKLQSSTPASIRRPIGSSSNRAPRRALTPSADGYVQPSVATRAARSRGSGASFPRVDGLAVDPRAQDLDLRELLGRRLDGIPRQDRRESAALPGSSEPRCFLDAELPRRVRRHRAQCLIDREPLARAPYALLPCAESAAWPFA